MNTTPFKDSTNLNFIFNNRKKVIIDKLNNKTVISNQESKPLRELKITYKYSEASEDGYLADIEDVSLDAKDCLNQELLNFAAKEIFYTLELQTMNEYRLKKLLKKELLAKQPLLKSLPDKTLPQSMSKNAFLEVVQWVISLKDPNSLNYLDNLENLPDDLGSVDDSLWNELDDYTFGAMKL